jgi:hypothetical protein
MDNEPEKEDGSKRIRSSCTTGIGDSARVLNATNRIEQCLIHQNSGDYVKNRKFSHSQNYFPDQNRSTLHLTKLVEYYFNDMQGKKTSLCIPLSHDLFENTFGYTTNFCVATYDKFEVQILTNNFYFVGLSSSTKVTKKEITPNDMTSLLNFKFRPSNGSHSSHVVKCSLKLCGKFFQGSNSEFAQLYIHIPQHVASSKMVLVYTAVMRTAGLHLSNYNF